MADLKELDRTLPAHYTLSNNNLILIAHVREETEYFFEYLGPTTTVILLTKPKCYETKRIFLHLLNYMGSTVIDLSEEEDNSKDYTLTRKSRNIINKIITENKYNRILTLNPEIDYQNRELYNIINNYMQITSQKHHYLPNKNNKCDQRLKLRQEILELYSKNILH